MQAYKQNADSVKSLERDFHSLIDQGLLRQDEEGNVHCVANWEEHQQLRQMKEAEILS